MKAHPLRLPALAGMVTALAAETVSRGSGDLGRVHQPDESNGLAPLPPAVERAGRLVHRFRLPI